MIVSWSCVHAQFLAGSGAFHVALHVSWIPMFGRNASIAGGLFTLLTQFKAGELITVALHTAARNRPRHQYDGIIPG